MEKICISWVYFNLSNDIFDRFKDDFKNIANDECLKSKGFMTNDATTPHLTYDKDFVCSFATFALPCDTSIDAIHHFCKYFVERGYVISGVKFDIVGDDQLNAQTIITKSENLSKFIECGDVVDDKDCYAEVGLDFVKANCKEGWKLNPNEKVVNGIIRGINRNKGLCPCNNDSYDKKCPCSNYREHDHCCCTLYVK